ncbi:MAG: SpoIID/LytB domain-containing protein, partial [Actinomycetota bacterium]|nr:SpoIID/LytB domain-containing protein [Actinomycetota bacterium]
MFRRSRHREISTAAFLVGAAVVLFVVLGVHGASAADDEWIIEGGGWGHGVGLSQYGAYGMGLDGFSADEILAHYYSGATQAQAADSLGVDHWIFEDEALWIGLEQNAPTVEIEAVNGGLAVCQTGDGTGDCLVPDLVINPGETWRFEVIPESEPVLCRFVDSLAETESLEGSCAADVTWVDNADLEDPSVATLVRVNGEREYAHGSLRIRPNDPNPAIANSLHVSLSISLEDYLYGVAEVPSSWPDATLAAQTMIARSFGVAAATRRAPEGTLPAHRQRDCWCHLDATSVDQ